MRLARLLAITFAIAGGLAFAVPNVLRAVRQLHTLTAPTRLLPAASPPHRHVSQAPRTEHHAAHAAPSGSRLAVSHARHHGRSVSLFLLSGLGFAAGLVLLWLAAVGLAIRRARRRRTRAYALYELHLSTHDQAKSQDLEDMVESIANIVRAWPADRARHGQPYFALELICSAVEAPGDRPEMEWSINIRCEPRTVVALDGAISAAYPDVRLGRIHGEQPRPRAGCASRDT